MYPLSPYFAASETPPGGICKGIIQNDFISITQFIGKEYLSGVKLVLFCPNQNGKVAHNQNLVGISFSNSFPYFSGI